MAEVAFSSHHRSASSIGSMAGVTMAKGGPQIEMMPNPDFSFPMLPQVSSPRNMPRGAGSRRPVSMHSNAPSPQLSVPIAHRRVKSGAPLPTFSFNAADARGRQDSSTPPLTPDETDAVSPSRRMGHRRGGSELVGGDSRYGMGNAISSSPTKTTTLPLPIPSPVATRGHKHRRSGATSMSTHDATSIMHPGIAEPRLSSSLPSTPLEHPAITPPHHRAVSDADVTEASDPFGPPLDTVEARPPSRRVVGFADKVDYIPRPLSTISSETESSMSTVQGHSVNDSISSVLSLSSPSPPSTRNPRTSLSTTFEDGAKPRARSSLEVSKRIEKEGEWLRSSSSSQNMRRPLSESAASPNLSFDVPQAPASARPRNVHNKKHSLSQALGLDRRRSEPVISLKADEQARLSAISLHEEASKGHLVPEGSGARRLERRSSSRTIKDWAVSKMGIRSKEAKKVSAARDATATARPRSAGEASVPGKVPVPEPAAAETNLDAVFNTSMDVGDTARMGTPPQPRIEVSTPTPSHTSSFQSRESDDTSPVLDLDAALGPFKTPSSFQGTKQRRELHSSRLAKDFSGPGLHYHRRAESAPELPPFGFSRGSTASVTSLPDVFEGEGEEEADTASAVRPVSSRSAQDDEASIGIQVVDADADGVSPGSMLDWGPDDGLGIQRAEWEPERPTTSHGPNSRLSTPIMEQRRASSIIEETIPEELSPVEPVEIVESYEEPRASSLTKSSDSSETPTLLASHTGTLALPDGAQSLMTPDTYQTSTFSSPDFARRQGSFDTSRLGTSASSIADNRTMSSCADQGHEVRMSVDDVPSLTSSRSTMISTMHANTSRRDFSNNSGDRTPSVASAVLDPAVAAERRRKRASIQSLSQLVGNSFSSKSKATVESRPHTAVDSTMAKAPKKEHRLKKLMFWRSKSKQSLHSTS
ncbi:hypothetical protein LTR85_001411 [Meristemomyces frigidus]|nr:hypothetical protein LTR85_001411 [Meristemomyces frigidus]